VAPQPTIRIRDLRFRYRDGDFALRVPELSVRPQERVAVIGPSGSGKTTLLHLVAGIVLPDEGRIHTAGADMRGLDDAGRRAFRVEHVGLVFQEFELVDYLTVLENVLLPYRIHPVLRLDAEVRQRAVALAGRVGIADKLTRLPAELSHGERQRIAVCRALVTRPLLVLADEPTGNLDPSNRDRVLEILIDCVGETGASLLTVTHDRDLLPRFDRVIDFATLTGVAGAA